MFGTFRAEARKLLTVRGTYYFILTAAAITLFYAGFITGFRITPLQLHDPTFLSQQVLGAISFVTLFGGIAGLQLMAHEYRHNTIIYTLTLAKSRSQVLVAKILVVSLFMLAFGAFIMLLSPLATILGAHLHGYHLVPQTLNYSNLAWRSLFYDWSYGMYALIIITLIRNQIGAIVSLLVIPILAENILAQLLKSNVKDLPFTALNEITDLHPVHGVTPTKAIPVILTYIIVGWIIAWLLFLRRDAN